MKEIVSLLEKAKRYLTSADLLFNDGDYESCVSRAYYAMFYCTEALLLTKNLTFSSHKGVISAFGQYFVKTNEFSKNFSRDLNQAFEKRQLGEYEYTFVITKDEAEELLLKSNYFFNEIINYLKSNHFLE